MENNNSKKFWNLSGVATAVCAADVSKDEIAKEYVVTIWLFLAVNGQEDAEDFFGKDKVERALRVLERLEISFVNVNVDTLTLDEISKRGAKSFDKTVKDVAKMFC